MNSNQKQTNCLGGRHYSNNIDLLEYEKLNPKTQKFVKDKKGKCDICR